MTRSVKVNLNDKASEDLSRIANELGITETEVLRKGLAVMGVYSKVHSRGDSALMVKQGDEVREIIIA
jgi:hypothetical protein